MRAINWIEGEIGTNRSRERAKKGIFKDDKDWEDESGTNTIVVMETRTELGRRLGQKTGDQDKAGMNTKLS